MILGTIGMRMCILNGRLFAEVQNSLLRVSRQNHLLGYMEILLNYWLVFSLECCLN
jgi:hypothetical protein